MDIHVISISGALDISMIQRIKRTMESFSFNFVFLLTVCAALPPSQAWGDQFCRMPRPANYSGDFWSGFDNSESVGSFLFASEESPIIRKVALNGVLVDNYNNQLRTADIKNAGLEAPFHMLGDKQGLINNRNYVSSDNLGEMVIELMPNYYREDGGWDLSAIEVKTLNIAGLSDPVLSINGREVPVKPELEYDWSVLSHIGTTGIEELRDMPGDEDLSVRNRLREGTLPGACYYAADGRTIPFESLKPGMPAIAVAPTGLTLKFIR